MSKETKRSYKIIVPYGSVKKLAQFFDVNEQTVRRALNYDSMDSEVQRAIRRTALRDYLGQRITITRPIN